MIEEIDDGEEEGAVGNGGLISEGATEAFRGRRQQWR